MSQTILKLKLKSLVASYFVILAYILAFTVCAYADTITYTYYDTGELRKTIYAAGTTIEYLNDPSGNRTSKIVSSTKPIISVSPTTLDLGSVTVGNVSVTKSVTVNNTGTGQLDIESVSMGGSNPDEFSMQDHCSGVSLIPTGSCNIDIVFSPISGGSKGATLSIVSDAPDQLIASASLVGNTTPTQLYNLSVTIGGSGTGTMGVDSGSLIWIGNIGTASYTANTQVTISEYAAPNSDFSWSGDCIGNGSSCSVLMTSNKSVTATFESKANFNANPIAGPAPLLVTFTDISTNTPTAWLWNFGDNVGSSTSQSPTYTYVTPGNYSVSLTATGTGGAASRTITDLITVTACNNNPVNIGGTSAYYSSIQSAYNAATTGESVLMQAISFAETLNLQNNTLVTVTLLGGYGCDFSVSAGFTTVQGTLTISSGTVTIENLIIQ